MPVEGSGGMPDTDQTDDQQQQDQAQDQQTDDLTGLKSALQAERDARKNEAKELKEIKRQLAELRGSSKTDADRVKELEAEKKDLAAKVRERDAQEAVIEAAKKAGAPDPLLVFRTLKSDLDIDDDGTIRNLSTLISDTKALHPQLFKAPPPGKGDGAAGNGSKPKNFDMNAQIRAMAGREA